MDPESLKKFGLLPVDKALESLYIANNIVASFEVGRLDQLQQLYPDQMPDLSLFLGNNESNIPFKLIDEVQLYSEIFASSKPNNLKANSFDADFFAFTTQTRKFFSNDPSISCSEMLYGIGISDDQTRKFWERNLNNRFIINVGGGYSRFTSELQAAGYSPKKVLNVDPFVDAEYGIDQIVRAFAQESSFHEKIQSRYGINNANRLFVSIYAAPFYLQSGDEISSYFENIGQSEIGDEWRIYPISLFNPATSLDGWNPDSLEQRAESIVNGIKSLAEKQKFQIYTINEGSTLVAKKVA